MEKYSESLSLGAGDVIYAFYSSINEQKEDLQFLYSKDEDFEIYDDLIINKKSHHNYITKGVEYIKEGLLPTFASEMILSLSYRGERLVRQIWTEYDNTIDKFVQVYKKKNTEQKYYGFTKTEYVSPNIVTNYVVNSTAFSNTSGWYLENNEEKARPQL
jgi:hypothetical protein